jgi:hypothetical protein
MTTTPKEFGIFFHEDCGDAETHLGWQYRSNERELPEDARVFRKHAYTWLELWGGKPGC